MEGQGRETRTFISADFCCLSGCRQMSKPPGSRQIHRTVQRGVRDYLGLLS